MTKQDKLIGKHPDNSNPFGRWLAVNDIPISDTKCHRELTEITSRNDELIEWMAKKIINHHYTQFRINRLKEKYKELGFTKYAEQHRKLPTADKVKKGHATEIILTDYVQTTLGKELIKVFKLKYNPNVDQAIKGDDTLMVDLVETNGVNNVRVYLGEAKFRQTPTSQVINDIVTSLNKDTLPLSYTFLVEEIAKDNLELAIKLDDFIIKDIKDKGDLIYTGLLLSNSETSSKVENHLNSDNPDLVFISMGIDNPQEFIQKIFERAEELILKPEKL